MSLRHAVLATLFTGPQSGYELAKKFDEGMRGVWYARKNQMYGELAALTEAGFAEEGARGRRSYAVTPAGRAELHRWLVEIEPDRTARSESMLRGYLVSLLPSEDALKVLTREETELRTRADHYRGCMDKLRNTEVPNHPALLGIDLQVRMTEAMLDWTREAKRRLANE